MEVPEKLALIGGSILLSSTLIFTLKSQASQVIPNIGRSISGVFDHIGDAKKNSKFKNDFAKAKRNGWQIGTWGSTQYYIDDQHNMYIGTGKMQGSLSNVVSDGVSSNLKSITFTGPVQAPQDSSWLLAASPHRDGYNLKAINGLANLDTSHVTKMNSLFESNCSPTSLDISGWDTSQVETTEGMFSANRSLRSLDLRNWDVSKMSNTAAMFNNNNSLQSLNLSGWNTSHDSNMSSMFGNNDSLNDLSLGGQAKLSNNVGLSSQEDWQSNNDTLHTDQLIDNNGHQGNWISKKINLAPDTSDEYYAGSNNQWNIPVQKGKTYYISAHPNSGYNSFTSLGGPSIQYVGKDNDRSIYRFTSDRDGTLPIGFGYGSGAWNIDHLTITQSDSYVPLERTSNNDNYWIGAPSNTDKQQPNLAPVTSDSNYTGANNQWNIPVQKGKTYYVSAHPNSGYNSFTSLGGPSMQYVEGGNGRSIYRFTSDRDGTLPIGFGYGGGAWNIDHLTITQTNAYVPFEIAENNKKDQ